MKNLYYGVLHCLAMITSVIFVATTIGMNVPLALLCSGIGTIVFTAWTRGKYGIGLGISGAYISAVISVGATYGASYAVGGTLIAGVFYVLVGLLMKKFPGFMKLFSPSVLSLAVIFIALTLIPIGISVIEASPITAVVTLIAIIVLSNIKAMKAVSFPLAIGVGTLFHALTYGLAPTTMTSNLVFMAPAFNLAGFLAISLASFAVMFEGLGDSKLISDITNQEYEPHKVITGNGVATIISSLLGCPIACTTYSESGGFLLATNHFKWQSSIICGITFIILALIPQLTVLISYIPMACFGAILLYLFTMIMSLRITELNLNNDKLLTLGIVGLSSFYLAPIVLPSVSQVAVAMFCTVLTDKLMNLKK